MVTLSEQAKIIIEAEKKRRLALVDPNNLCEGDIHFIEMTGPNESDRAEVLSDIVYCQKCGGEHVRNHSCLFCEDAEKNGYYKKRLLGRLSNGFEADGGYRVHAIQPGSDKAFCGIQPGRRSWGWSNVMRDSVSCPKCLAVIKRKFR